MIERGFKVLGIEHVAFAPKVTDDLRNFFSKNLGLVDQGSELVKSQQTQTYFFNSGSAQSRLEILEAAEPGQGPVAAFLDKKGAGIHHLALRVDNIEAALSFLIKQGVKLIDQSPKPGAHGSKIAFIHPHATGGILIELVEL